MPPTIHYGTSTEPRISGTKPLGDYLMQRSSNHIGHTHAAIRAYMVCRKTGNCFIGDRILLNVTCAEGDGVSEYVSIT
jgi:hypothetical protein